MLLQLFTHLSLFALASSSQLLQKRQGHYDITRYGRYTIVNCGTHDGTHLARLLDNLRTALQPSLHDVSLADPSLAFDTFFGSTNNAPYVRQLLTNVTTGVPLYPPEHRFHQTGSPLLICATGEGQVVGKRNAIDYYYQCILDPSRSLIVINRTPYIVICPYLFSSRVPDEPPADTCLTVNTAFNSFRGTGVEFTGFKVWTLLEAILKYYIFATTRFSGSFASNVNRCVGLGAKWMVQNPSNYVYYVASIYGNCRDFPNLSVPRRKLLDNTTTPELMEPEYGGPNATGSATSSQAVVVDPFDSLDI